MLSAKDANDIFTWFKKNKTPAFDAFSNAFVRDSTRYIGKVLVIVTMDFSCCEYGDTWGNSELLSPDEVCWLENICPDIPFGDINGRNSEVTELYGCLDVMTFHDPDEIALKLEHTHGISCKPFMHNVCTREMDNLPPVVNGKQTELVCTSIGSEDGRFFEHVLCHDRDVQLCKQYDIGQHKERNARRSFWKPVNAIANTWMKGKLEDDEKPVLDLSDVWCRIFKNPSDSVPVHQ